MSTESKPKTSAANGRLWGARARDWAEIQEGQVRPVYLAVLDQVLASPGLNYLDAGCGAGMAAQLAAERGARVSGLDAAENLLAIARQRVPQGDFRRGELEELPFADRAFDVVTGFNSFQYAGNPVAALSAAARVTKAGGTVVIMTWGNPEGMEAAALVAAIKPLLPPPPPGTPGPFALSQETELRAFAAKAGLAPGAMLDVSSPWIYPSLDVAVRGLMSAGVAARAVEHTSETAVTQAYTAALSRFRTADGSYRIGATFRCLFARPA